jgi:hypothetical protein
MGALQRLQVDGTWWGRRTTTPTPRAWGALAALTVVLAAEAWLVVHTDGFAAPRR